MVDLVAWIAGRFGALELHADIVLEIARADGPRDAKTPFHFAAFSRHEELIAFAPEAAVATLEAQPGLAAEIAENMIGRCRRIHPAMRVLRPGLVFFLMTFAAVLRSN